MATGHPLLSAADRWGQNDCPIYRVDIIGHNNSEQQRRYDDDTLDIPIIYESPSLAEMAGKTAELHGQGFVTTGVMTINAL